MLRMACLALLAAASGGPAHAQAPPDAPAMSDEVRRHWERGLAEYAARRYQDAAAELAACYRIAERRECLFAWAQAARLGGDCETAAALYRRYLEAELSPRQVEAARGQLAACEAVLAARATRPDRPDEPRATGPRPGAPARDAPRRAPWYRDGWGDALVGAGVAGVAAGAWLFIAARRDAAATAPTYDAYEERFSRAERTRTWSLVALGAGSAAIAAGVAHMVLREAAPSPAPREARVGFAVGAAELAIRYTGRF